MKTLIRTIAFLLASCAALLASSVKDANLELMVRLSDRIVVGTCISAQPSQLLVQGHYLAVTRYRFRLSENLKGIPGADYELQQIGWPHSSLVVARNTPQPTQLQIDGMPEYQVGAEYLLMMTRPSRLGLSSPVGLEQSVFRALRDGVGRAVWQNGVANRGLFDGLTLPALRSLESAGLPRTGSTVAYRDFIELIRQLAAGSR